MKRLLCLLVYIPTLPCLAEAQEDIPLGIEAVTGLRSAYTDRGLDLADTVLDFQLESEIALNDTLFANLASWYLAEGDDAFSENAFSFELTQQWNSLSLTGGILYRDVNSEVIESGLDFSAALRWEISRDLSFTTTAGYEEGADSLYGQLQFDYSQSISENAFWSLRGGVSLADDFYGLSGLTEIYARASLTYLITSQASLTPFIGVSESPDDSPFASSTIYAGAWFAVSF